MVFSNGEIISSKPGPVAYLACVVWRCEGNFCSDRTRRSSPNGCRHNGPGTIHDAAVHAGGNARRSSPSGIR